MLPFSTLQLSDTIEHDQTEPPENLYLTASASITDQKGFCTHDMLSFVTSKTQSATLKTPWAHSFFPPLIVRHFRVTPPPLSATTAYYKISFRDTVRKCLPVCFLCLCVSAKPPPHNTPTHMARDGWRQNDSSIALCEPNNAETHCCVLG